MTSAAELQRSITGFLRQRRDLTKNEAARRFAELHLGGNERLSPVQQLEIYREQFWLRHTASPLGQACESAAAECGISPEDLGADLETWFGSWAARGYVIDIAID